MAIKALENLLAYPFAELVSNMETIRVNALFTNPFYGLE